MENLIPIDQHRYGSINTAFADPSFLETYVMFQFHALALRDIVPSFAAFQCTQEWAEMRQKLSLPVKRQLILTFDRLSAELRAKIN